MQRSDSVSSTGSRASGTFGYHARYLDATSTGSSSSGSLSRAPSILSPPPGASTTRKFVPTHRTGLSVDAIQSKTAIWEEYARANQADMTSSPTKSPTKPENSIHRRSVDYSRLRQEAMMPPPPPPKLDNSSKRHTLPSPLNISSYIATLNDSAPQVTTPTQIRYPNVVANGSPTKRHVEVQRQPDPQIRSTGSWKSPEAIPETVPENFTGSSTVSGSSNDTVHPTTPDQPKFKSSYMLQRRSAKKYGDSMTSGKKLGRHMPRIASDDGNPDPEGDDLQEVRPTKANTQHKVQLHDPEVPSPVSYNNTQYQASHWEKRRDAPLPTPPPSQEIKLSRPLSTAGDVIPGRLKLSRDASAPPTPIKSATRPASGLWADVQRHHIQAYEYLCHVGEAQQWIEGCLGEELGFGVVEMDEGLRNGVVLARLAQVWDRQLVRKIFDDPRLKLGWRHTDNINNFLVFVRSVGLPECFIFIVTDLYDKKNFPKVVYCIHALSHLLARRGMAERIGNLVGRLQFTDDQLQQTQRGLKAAGVPMPNFGDIGRELAKEINEEVEQEVETEDERRDRMLLEVEESIVKLQAICRGSLARESISNKRERLHLAERYVIKFQARLRGALTRSQLAKQRTQHQSLHTWARALQAAARGKLARAGVQDHLRRIRQMTRYIIKMQAQSRGVLTRRQYQKLRAGLRTSSKSVLKLQSIARARLARNQHQQLSKVLHQPIVLSNVVQLQAAARGALARRRDRAILSALKRSEPFIVGLQAHSHGALTRRRMRTQLAKLDDVADVIISIQAAARAFMARKRLLNLIRGLRKATPFVIALQAKARGNLVQKAKTELSKQLAEKKVIHSVGHFQTIARAALVRNQHREQQKKLDFVAPDVVGFQAMARAALVRNEYWAWRDHLHRSQFEAIYLQSLCRGILQRRKFQNKVVHYRTNLDKVVKIQSLFRANQQREQYKQLTLGKNVNVSTIKNFVHLLDDSEADFQEEIEVEELRKRVVEAIRENQQLETDVNELDVKIALVVQNVKSFEEVVKARRRHGADTAAAHAARASVLAAHGDPFAGPNTLDLATKKKLELYQQLFYLLQTKGEYLSRLFYRLSRVEVPDKTKRMAERVVLTLFGYGQDRREDFLLLKVFQMSIHEEVMAAPTIDHLSIGQPMFINVALHYIRQKQAAFIKDTLQEVIKHIVDADELDLETDPVVVHRGRINREEMRTGMRSSIPANLAYFEILEQDLETRKEFIHHLQKLIAVTKDFIAAITSSTKKVPYGLRYMASEMLAALKIKFPNQSDDIYAAALGRLIYYRYLNPAILAPETFDIVPNTISAQARRNLDEVSRVLTQISSGKMYGPENPPMKAIDDFMAVAIKQMGDWFLEVASVPSAENQLQAHEFLDATTQPKPIYISPNEVYSMHSLLLKHLDVVAAQREDPLRAILFELEGVPNLASGDNHDALHDARDRAITLELTNRFAVVKDEQAELKALWVRAKRGVLAILRVQPGKDLIESLMQPVTDEHELVWEEIVDNEMNAERIRHRSRRMASTTQADASYRLEDIRSQSFRDMKAHAIFFLLELEKQSQVTRHNGYQDVLDAIASDVRSKHRKRVQRQQEKASMREALRHLKERRKYFEEQIKSYNDYVDMAMSTMQRGKGPKRRFVMPFTKQFFHLRDLQRTGKSPQFGSFKYSAQDLYTKGILLSMDQFSPRQFDRIDVVISSNKIGVFLIEVYNSGGGAGGGSGLQHGAVLVASTEVRMEDLLQAQFENRVSLPLFDGMAKMNLNLLLYQINKKFYV